MHSKDTFLVPKCLVYLSSPLSATENFTVTIKSLSTTPQRIFKSTTIGYFELRQQDDIPNQECYASIIQEENIAIADHNINDKLTHSQAIQLKEILQDYLQNQSPRWVKPSQWNTKST